MRDSLLPYLQCISCLQGDLQLTTITREGDHVIEGVINCPSCGAIYPIVESIPRMSPTSVVEHAEFLRRHGHATLSGPGASMTPTARKTRAGFNEQFKSPFYARVETLKADFARKDQRNFLLATETTPSTARTLLEDKVFLDVGAGGGHYSYDALSFGATVISLDMNDVGLSTYYAAFKDNPRQHAIQASALRLPIKTESVDYAWSMGVLHHTDDLLQGFQEMARALKVGGIQSVGVYYRYRCWPYYVYMRKVTTRMPFFALWPLCHVLTWLSYLPRMSFLAHPWVDKGQPYRTRVTTSFDHFHPPIQGYYTTQEVESWYGELACFEDVHMTPVWNNFLGRKCAPLAKQFSESTKASLMRC